MTIPFLSFEDVDVVIFISAVHKSAKLECYFISRVWCVQCTYSGQGYIISIYKYKTKVSLIDLQINHKSLNCKIIYTNYLMQVFW